MHTRKEVHWRQQKLPSEESHPMTDPLGEQYKSCEGPGEERVKPNQIQ